MRSVSLGWILLVAFLNGLNSTSAQEHFGWFEVLNGNAISMENLAQGRWALGFVVIPGCPACEEFLPWFYLAARAFPEVKFLLIAPEATPELQALVEGRVFEIPVLLDVEGVFGTWLGVDRAPTVLLSLEGVEIDRLDWPFTQGGLFRKLAESLLVEIEFPDPKELLGQPAPDFSTTGLEGEEITLAELPRPLLLAFFNPGCSPGWDFLPALRTISRDVTVALMAMVGDVGLSAEDKKRLERFLREVGNANGSAAVLLDYWMEERGFGIASDFKVARSPTFILINEKGEITGVWEGRLEAEGLLEKVHTALTEFR